MRRPPPPHLRGAPRTAGSGRKKGTPNRRTVQMRELLTSLCHDVDYQYRLRADFRRRRVHPAIESFVWSHSGKARGAGPALRRRHDEPETRSGARPVQQLSLEQLEILAAESQALVNKAL